jgi:hypothetical protein
MVRPSRCRRIRWATSSSATTGAVGSAPRRAATACAVRALAGRVIAVPAPGHGHVDTGPGAGGPSRVSVLGWRAVSSASSWSARTSP